MAEIVDLNVSLSDLTDEELIDRYRQGDEVALEIILIRYKRFVTSKVRTYFLIGADDDDIMQEGMIGLFKAVKDYDRTKESSFKTFAGLCITRQIITAIKTATRQKHIPLNSYVSLNKKIYDIKEDKTLLDVISQPRQSDPEAIVIDRENLDGIEYKINKALSKLELQVLAYYLESRSYQEISKFINKDIKSVDNALQRVKKKVEALLKDAGND